MSPPASHTDRLRVAVDGLPLIGARTGVGQVTGHLVEALADRDDVDVVAYAVSRRGRALLSGLVPAGVTAACSALPARVVLAAWRRVPFPRVEHWTGPVDVVHATNYVAPPARAPVLVTIYDLTFVNHPELCRPETLELFAPLVPLAIERGATVHVTSEYVGREVRETYGVPAERVVRIHAGLAPSRPGDASAGRRLAGSERYVLALGTVEPRKNLPRLVRAFERVAERDRSLRLVVAGPDGWGTEEFAIALGSARHRDRIVRLGWVDDEARADLLAGAALLAYPSLYEGFGLPPLEAMAAGLAVVAGTAGSLPEILGDAAVFVDPLDESSIADGLDRVLGDDTLRGQLVDAGRRQAARFRWDRSAGELVDLYRRLAVATT